MPKKIPPAGLRDVALREAAPEYRAVINAVHQALERLLCTGAPNAPMYVDLAAIYPDAAIVEFQGKSWQYPYTLAADGTVTLGSPTHVVEQYVAADAVAADARLEAEGDAEGAPKAMREAVRAVFVESVDGGRWLIRVIRAGLSLNNVFYSDAVLREAAPLFEGARVFVKSDAEHIHGQGKDVRNLIGRLVEAKYSQGAMPDCGELRAKLELIQPDGPVATQLREAFERKMADLFGFSIDADGTAKTEMREGQRVKVAQAITKVTSVDLIVEPGAGGQLIRLVEAIQTQDEESNMALRLRMIEAVKAANGGKLPANLDINDDAALETAYREAVAQPAPVANIAGLEQQIRMIEARATARVAIAASTLPQPAKDKLLADFGTRERFTEADVTAAIEAERSYLARFTESGRVTGLGSAGRVEAGVSFADQCATMLDDFFNAKPGAHSFRECYRTITGDQKVTGRLSDCDPVRLREAAGLLPAQFREAMDSGTFALMLGDGIHRRIIADYRQPSQYDVWRPLVGTPVPINDFRKNERTRFGGFGDMPIVAEGDDYTEIANPSDEQAEYSIAKRGGVFSVTLEMTANDDVGLIRRLPVAAARACKRTLAKFVLDFIRTNPTIYDGKALFHADHGNLGSAALSAAAYKAARLAMLKQAELNTAEPIGIAPKYLWVAYDQEDTAADIFKRDTNLDETFIQSQKPTIISVWYWTDADDWAATADPMDVPLIELGFWNGNEEPEMFVQDSPTVGSVFAADKITYKLRHPYGANPLDYRGFYKAVVA